MPRTHKTQQRLYVDMPLSAKKTIKLDKMQSNYLANVLRKKTGDRLVLFNGRDGAWLAFISTVSRKLVEVETIECFARQPPHNDLWYGFAPLKSARLDYMAQKACEMGAGMIQPVVTEYTQIRRIKEERIIANVIEAAEQCEVLNLPQVLPQTSLLSLIENWPRDHSGRILIIADEEISPASPIEQLLAHKNRPLGLMIGPEGGFSQNERDLLRGHDFIVRISLGPRILRADTAAVAALALIQATIGDWD
ncbi:16S rRNA (uracil(1498)-N(3))-methyltransferase [hydrothermal vent metagenome]|uniref:16S rRNA (uracil(1498)-N(3))-methyltransferase n=1 Tax=hydrothermal vent metagenome TaxID=652676 RepID=A0A3B0TT56_9ZZZZ